MVFFISRPRLVPKTKLPVDTLNPQILHRALRLLIHGKDTSTAAKGLQQHGSQYEPLRYSYRLEKAPENQKEPSVPGGFPISAIVRSDMPRQFRAWLLEDDIIFFRTRAPSYLTEVSSSRQKEEEFIKECEQLGKLINARKQTILHDTYRTAARFWWVSPAVYVLFLSPAIWKETLRTFIHEPMVKGLGTTIFSWGQILSTFTSIAKVSVRTLVEIVCLWLVFILALPYLVAVCALPFEIHACALYNSDCSALFRDMIRSWFGLHREFPPGQLGTSEATECRRGWLRAALEEHGTPGPDIEEMLQGFYCCIDHHHDRTSNRPHKSPIATAWLWLWLLGATFRSTWCGSLRPCIQALRSFWAFHGQMSNMRNGISWYRGSGRRREGTEDENGREGTRQVNNSSSTQMELVIKRAKILEGGDLVVRLKPYPDLVNMTGLGWLNQLYLNYRSWRRWLLAEKVYRDLEMDTGKQQITLKTVMFHSVAKLEGGLGVRFRSRLVDVGDGRDGQEYLLVEMPVAENEQQQGEWLR